MELIKQRLGRYKDVYTACETKEETIDVIVPDCNPDYEREIVTFANCRVIDKSMLSGSLRVSGEIKAFVNYDANASENMYVVNASSPFAYSFDIPGGAPDDVFFIRIRTASAASEMLNSRKIRIRVKLEAEIFVYRMENVEITSDICGESGEKICVKSDNITHFPCIDISSERIAFTEEIRLSDEEVADFARLIRWSCKWNTEEVRVLQNKLMVRGTASLSVYSCREENNEVGMHDYILPFSQVIECKNCCETDIVDVNLAENCCLVDLITKEDENTYLRCEAYAHAEAFVYRETTGSIVLDVYSTEYEASHKNLPVCIECKQLDYRTEIPCEGKLDAQEGVSRILDKNISCVCRKKKDRITGRVYVSVLYEDAPGCIRSARNAIDFSVEAPEDVIPSSLCCCTENINISTDPTGIIVSLTVVIKAKVKNEIIMDQIGTCNVDMNKKHSRTAKGNLILRYPEKNESVWSIAKQYHTTKEAILSANDMPAECDILPQKLIIVPFVK